MTLPRWKLRQFGIDLTFGAENSVDPQPISISALRPLTPCGQSAPRVAPLSMMTETRLEGLHCTMVIEGLAPGVVLVTITGTDVGELGQAPFEALAPLLDGVGLVELFIDASGARGPSVDVSSEWARWLGRHRDRLRHASMLTASRFVQLTADFVREFAELGDKMRIYSDPAVFQGALSNAVGNARGAS